MIWTNLDMEWRLVHGSAASAQRTLTHQMNRWSHLMRCAPGASEHDTLFDPSHAPLPPHTPLHVWGVDARVHSAAPHLDWPSPESVLEANDKTTSFALRRAHGLEGLPASRIIEEIDDAEAACGSLGVVDAWLFKHPMGVSGQGILAGSGSLNGPQRRWVTRQLRSGWPLLFEPRVRRLEESSLHFDITRTGEVVFVGRCALFSDSAQTFRGLVVSRGEEGAPSSPRETTTDYRRGEIASCLEALSSQTGYWGAVGVDQFSGWLVDAPVFQAISEINARYSFGRVALDLDQFAPPGLLHWGWYHPPSSSKRSAPDEALSHTSQIEERGVTRLRLPESLDPSAASGTWLLVARQREEVEEAMAVLCGASYGPSTTR